MAATTMLSPVVLIRTLRPFLFVLGLFSVLGYRLVRAGLGVPDWEKDVTVLSFVLSMADQWRGVWDRLVTYDASTKWMVPLVSLGFQLLYDVFGILILVGMARLMYCLYHFTWAEIQHAIEDAAFEWAKQNIAPLARYLQEETDKMIPDFERSFGREEFQKQKQLKLPEHGREGAIVLKEMTASANKEHENWRSGKVSGTVYSPETEHLDLMNQIYSIYCVANNLHPGVWPRLNQCESELISMTSNMMHGTGVGCVTSGGTESLMLAIKAHWIYYGKQRGILHPELICGTTVHAAIDKACEVMGIRKVCIDCSSPATEYTLNPDKVRACVTSNTIMIIGSAPNYPQGTIDPIEELGKIATQYDIGLHVDSCLGGFVLPFAAERFPKFDFSVPGVTSMSADTHKFGYAPKGTSVVLYRNRELRHAQYFSYPKWSGGIYATPTFAGSRPSALVGCAWASLVTIGLDGYRERSRRILDASNRIAEGIRNEIPELYLLGQKDYQTMVVCFGSKQLDIYRIVDAMAAKGWSLNSLQNPPSAHVCVTLVVAPQAEKLIKDLKDVVADVKKEDPSKVKSGTAGIYGMTGSLPEGSSNVFVKAFVDVSLTP